jgi:hypothetical protein
MPQIHMFFDKFQHVIRMLVHRVLQTTVSVFLYDTVNSELICERYSGAFFKELNEEDKKLNVLVFSAEQCTNKHATLYRLFLSANRLTRIQRSSLPSPDVNVCNVHLWWGNLRQKFNRSNPRSVKAPHFEIHNVTQEITESELECVSQNALR